MVFVFGAAVGLFFLLADQAIRQGAAFLLELSVK
jgi:preprotein translocase subunit SecE